MKLVHNTGTDRVANLLQPHLVNGAHLDAVTQALSVFAVAHLLPELRRAARCRLVLPADLSTMSLLGSAADRGSRRFLLVQLPEALVPDVPDQKVAADFCDKLGKPRTIAELTKERLRRAAKKIKDEDPLFAGDLGFRVFKLDSSNIRAWEPDRDDLDGTLRLNAEHLKADRTEQDILYELLLKLGLDLCVPIESKTIAGKTVHSIGGGVLLACLATQISRDEVEPLSQGILDWHNALAPAGDTTCVFRDSAFDDDVAKTNLAAIMNQHGLTNVRSL